MDNPIQPYNPPIQEIYANPVDLAKRYPDKTVIVVTNYHNSFNNTQTHPVKFRRVNESDIGARFFLGSTVAILAVIVVTLLGVLVSD